MSHQSIHDFISLDLFITNKDIAVKKPTVALNRAALSGLGLKGLPVKSDALKAAKTAAAMDDSTESIRELQTLGDMPAVDMTMAEDAPSVGENLEGDDDEEEAVKMDVDTKPQVGDAVDEDDEDDPLDAFMTVVTEEVSKVNAEDRQKMTKNRQTRNILDGDADADEEEEYEIPADELDTTDLNPEDILALAAKKAKKKDLAVVDHSRVVYEPFRKAFYHPPPDIAEMTEEEAELLRLELDGIKIRGLDCPKPVTKWSHFGMPATWYVVNALLKIIPI